MAKLNLLVGSLLLVAGVLSAAPLNQSILTNIPIANTGTLDANGRDTAWTVNGVAAYSPPDTAFPFPGHGIDPYTWAVNSSTSRWITPYSDFQGIYSHAPGTYTYTTTFSMAGLLPYTAEILVRMTADNYLRGYRFNNGPLILPANAALVNHISFTELFQLDTAGLTSGLNTLTFVIENAAGTVGNPTGFRAEFVTAAARPVPEPGTWALMASGMGLLVFARARRKRQ